MSLLPQMGSFNFQKFNVSLSFLNSTESPNASNINSFPTNSAMSSFTTAIISIALPLLVPLALFNNILVVLVFTRSTEVARRLSPTVRVYYIGMALSVINSVIPLQLTYFLGDGLNILTGGRAQLYWDQQSTALCKVRGTWYYVSAGYCTWILVVLTGERLCALCCPFSIKRWSSTRNAVILSIGLLFYCILFTIPASIVYDVTPNTAYLTGRGCLPRTDRSLALALAVTFVSLFNCFVYPLVLLMALTSALACRLCCLARMRRRRSSSTGALRQDGKRSSTYELRVHYAPRVENRVGHDTLIVHSSVEIIHPIEGHIKTKQGNYQQSLIASASGQESQVGNKVFKSGVDVEGKQSSLKIYEQRHQQLLDKQLNIVADSKAKAPSRFQAPRTLPRVSTAIGMCGWANRCGSTNGSIHARNLVSITQINRLQHLLLPESNSQLYRKRIDGSSVQLTTAPRYSGSIVSAAEGMPTPFTYREVDAAFTILLIAAAECLVNIPSGLFWMMSYMSAISIIGSTSHYSEWLVISRGCLSLVIVVKAAYIYLYMIKVPSFKRELFHIIWPFNRNPR